VVVMYNGGGTPHRGPSMSDTGPTFADHLRRHLTSLEAAGVRFVPKAGPAPPMPVWEGAAEVVEETPAERTRVALDLLAAEVAKCEKCPALFATRSQTVFGGGPLNAEVCFIGDAPRGDDELFPGDVGELLNRQLSAMGLDRDEVYFTPPSSAARPAPGTPSRTSAPTAVGTSNANSNWLPRGASAAWVRRRRNRSWACRPRSRNCGGRFTTGTASRWFAPTTRRSSATTRK
jgi:hypothetical protein